MFQRLKEFYLRYQQYLRVDFVMYGVLILLILLYFLYTVIMD